MFGNYFYNESMRRMAIGFGQIFNNIQIKRKDDTGKVIQTIRVPLAYGPKEKFLVRLDQQSSLSNREFAITLPRMVFEIQFVEDQEPFFQLGQLPVYKLRCTRFEYSSERLDTGVSDIDAAEDKYSLDQLAHQMSLENEDGALLLEADGADSSSNYLLLESYNLQTQSPYADNNDLDQQAGFDTSSTADDILDFTERNPFGEVDF